MSTAAKRLERMARSPGDNWQIGDVKTVCSAFGVRCEPPNKGSHYKISHTSQEEILTIPARRPIKAYYIRELVAFIGRVKEDDG